MKWQIECFTRVTSWGSLNAEIVPLFLSLNDHASFIETGMSKRNTDLV